VSIEIPSLKFSCFKLEENTGQVLALLILKFTFLFEILVPEYLNIHIWCNHVIRIWHLMCGTSNN